MELTIKGEPKEIAALLLEIERQQVEIHSNDTWPDWLPKVKWPGTTEEEWERQKKAWQAQK